MKCFRQETEWTCGPAVMRSILLSCDIRISERKLAKLMKTGKKHGTSNKQFVIAANKFGLDNFTKKAASIKELKTALKQKYRIIVCYYLKKEKTGHYALIRGINKKKIYLSDPSHIKPEGYSIKYFKTIWHGAKTPRGWFIAIKKISRQEL